MLPQVDHGNASQGKGFKSTSYFDDPADAAVSAAKYIRGLDEEAKPGWIEDGSATSSELLAELEHACLSKGEGLGHGDALGGV